MRHRNYGAKLGRTRSHRLALFRNLVTSLLEHERIETTDAKAKHLRRLADRMITLGKRGDLAARRRAQRVIRSRDVTGKVFGELAERFRSRPGGYTRVLKLRTRIGDAAPISIVELIDRPQTGKPAAGKTAAAAEKPGKKAPAKAKPVAKAPARTRAKAEAKPAEAAAKKPGRGAAKTKEAAAKPARKKPSAPRKKGS